MEPDQVSYGKQLFTLILSVAIVMTGFGIIFPIFPQLLVIVGGGDASDLGTMAAAFGLAYLIASPIFGNIADSFGKKRVILIGLLGFSTSNLVYIYATEVWHFYLARAVEGAFSSAILPPAIALTTQLTPKEERAKYIGYIVSGNTVGLIIGPLLGGVLYDGITISGITLVTGSLFLPFWVSLGIGMFAFVFGYFALPSAHNNRVATTRYLTEDEENELLNNKGVVNFLKHQIDVLPRPLYMFLIFIFVDIFAVLPWLIVSPGFIFYFYDELFLSASDFGYFVAAYGLFAAFGQAFLGNLSDTYGRKKLILLGQIFAVFFYATMPFGRVSWHFILIAALAGISSGFRDPALKALLSDVTDEQTRATAFGIESGLISVSQIIGPIVGGILYVTAGITTVFAVSIAITIINIGFIFILRFEARDVPEAAEDFVETPSTLSH